MKFLSDIDSINGKPAVEWEYSDGYRMWETFDTTEAMDVALVANQKYNDAHAAEIKAIEDEQHEAWLHAMMVNIEADPSNKCYLSESEIAAVEVYRTNLLAKYSPEVA